MIDLDQAQLDAANENGWDAHLRLGGRVVVLRHPSRIQAKDRRVGIVPAIGAGIARLWRLVFGGSEIAALRREMLGTVEEGDVAGLAAVRGFGLWELTVMHRAYTQATARLNGRVAMAALTKAVKAGSATAPVDAAVNAPSKPVETASVTQGQRIGLSAGGGRMPGIMGGQLWGAEWVKANPEAAAQRLRERIERDRAALDELQASRRQGIEASGSEQSNQAAEVTNGG